MLSKKKTKLANEFYGVISIIIIFVLCNDKSLLEYLDKNNYIKIFIFLLSLCMVYQKIEWKFILMGLIFFAVFFSNFVPIIKNVFSSIFMDIKMNIPKKENNNDLMKLGAKMFSLIKSDEKKGILKKVRFETEDEKYDDTEMCDKVSNRFGLNDDPESEPDTDGEDTEDLKKNLKDFINNI